MEYIKSLSILQKANNFSLELNPFPHLIIQNALPQELANTLTKNFPISSFQANANNTRFDISASKLSEIKDLANPWKEFIKFHTSQEFFYELIKIFGNEIIKKNDRYFSSLADLQNMRVGTRNIDSLENCDIFLDTQISINSAVQSKGAVRKVHTDHTNKLFSGLLYLRQPNDNSEGGALNLYKWKEGYTEKDKVKHYKESLDERHIDFYKQVKYENNVCIIFLNSIDALHAVTPRQITSHERTFVNFIGELPYDIYVKRPFIRRIFQHCKSLIKKLVKYLKL